MASDLFRILLTEGFPKPDTKRYRFLALNALAEKVAER